MMAGSPHQFLPEGTDGFGLDESPCDSSDLNQLNGWIRSGHTLLGEEDGSRLCPRALGVVSPPRPWSRIVKELYVLDRSSAKNTTITC